MRNAQLFGAVGSDHPPPIARQSLSRKCTMRARSDTCEVRLGRARLFALQ